MAYHKYNANDKDGYAQRGTQSEILVKDILIDLGYDIKDTTLLENKKGKDLYVNGYAADVKRRSSKKCFIEVKVNNKPGWLYKDSTYIIFHFYDIDYLYICKTEDLRMLYELNDYKSCGRKEYNEELFVLPLDDLFNITKKIIKV